MFSHDPELVCKHHTLSVGLVVCQACIYVLVYGVFVCRLCVCVYYFELGGHDE